MLLQKIFKCTLFGFDMSEERKHKDTIEINLGKHFGKIRENPWMLSTIVLIVVLLGVLIFGSLGGVSGELVSGREAGEKLVSFINSNSELGGGAELVSSERDGQLYQVTVNFQGQDIPVYVTLDGNYFVSSLVPISSGIGGVTDDSLGDSERVVVDESEIADSYFKGDENAPVVLIEFTDYQCPFCGRHFAQTYPLIEEEYVKTGKIKYVVMDFPLSFHENAQKAAEAARCVGEQKGNDGYFEMHDTLFGNQQDLSIENYKKWAREIGVNGAQFDSCLDDGKYEAAVQADLSYGQSVGVSGTPGFIINGVEISGALPFENFKQIIDSELSN